jgi:hypothetical protein
LINIVEQGVDRPLGEIGSKSCFQLQKLNRRQIPEVLALPAPVSGTSIEAVRPDVALMISGIQKKWN